MGQVRSQAERKADALLKLSVEGPDLWVATASSDGRPHLVPLSFLWDGRAVTIATLMTSPTARNLAAAHHARLALGGHRDVVIIDAVLDGTVPTAEVAAELADRYATRAGWDPRAEPEGYAYLMLLPHRIQVWREASEIPGRTVMRRGEWLV
jgi:hypothetical protein